MTNATEPRRRRSAKRGNREGSIYFHEAQKLWRASVTLDSGKRKYLSSRTRQEVAAKLGKTLRDVQQGIAPADDRQLLGSWRTQYVDGLEAQKVSDGTLVRYRGVLRNYLIPQFGKMRLSQLQPQHVKVYQDDLSRHGFSASSITIHRTVLGGAIKQAVAFGMLSRNAVALVKPPRENKDTTGRMLTPVEARALLDSIRGDRLEAFYPVLLTAGLRRGEALGLRWVDLDLERPNGSTLHVRQQLQWPGGLATLRLHLRRTKFLCAHRQIRMRSGDKRNAERCYEVVMRVLMSLSKVIGFTRGAATLSTGPPTPRRARGRGRRSA
jgi:integrase-like protein